MSPFRLFLSAARRALARLGQILKPQVLVVAHSINPKEVAFPFVPTSYYLMGGSQVSNARTRLPPTLCRLPIRAAVPVLWEGELTPHRFFNHQVDPSMVAEP